MWDLVPFAIVTFIVILVFAFMFFIQEYKEEGYEHFYASTLTVFSSFVGDPRPAEGPLDLIFGVVVVVVLLNVVIAIVSASWENAVNTSLILLCTHRLQLLRRANDNSAYLPKWFSGEWWIDTQFEELMEKCVEEVREEYDFWVGFNQWHPTAFLWSVLYLFMFLLRPFTTVLMWIMGAATFGLTWSLSVRMYLFGINPSKDTLYTRMERMEDATQDLSMETYKIHAEIKTYNEMGKGDGPSSSRDKEIDLLHDKIDNLRELFDRTRTSGSGPDRQQQRPNNRPDQSNGGGTRNDDSHNGGGGPTNVEMEQEMMILHTKIDLVLEYVMSQSAHGLQRRSMTNGYNVRRSAVGNTASSPNAARHLARVSNNREDATNAYRSEDFREGPNGVVHTSNLHE
jgi:hypothetical protein